MADIQVSQREVLERLQRFTRVIVPLPDCAATRLLAPVIGREWNDHLWAQRASAFLPLRDYIRRGEQSLAERPSRDFAVRIARLDSLIVEARHSFMAHRASFFWRCALLDRRARRKHWPVLGKSDATVQRDSALRNVSFFRPSCQEADIHRGLFLAMGVVPDEFLTRLLRFIAVDFGTPIGFAGGRATSLVLFDVDCVAMHAHAYPITGGEIGDTLLVSAGPLGITPAQLLAVRDGPELTVQAVPLRKVYRPRLPSIGRDRFELLDAVEWNRSHTETYPIPAAAERTGLQRGDLVQLTFNIRVSKAKKTTERIWVIVDRKIGDFFVGVVDNDSEFHLSHNLVKRGDEVAFRPENVCNVSAQHFRNLSTEKLSAYIISGDPGQLL